ncbi:MAG: ATP-binding cassette domain-containing protein [Chloroflexi bacterium]|nr:MAG: ATP-binding cassette domain-containing protein [Chloroflexota bacterium]
MSIVLENLTKHYENYPVVNNVSLEVDDGEFFVLLGSSGSGKTTILSIIAGLVHADRGRILLHRRDVTYLPTQQRKVGFVFQNYALFQHMSVADNVEFGLSIRKVPSSTRRRRCDELLELVGLSGLGRRFPGQLSGGQQQRVALARALAHDPDVLLLDEPLGALDAKIRVELRSTLKEIQRRLGIAAILVTHDQEEAFDLADRIGVMSYGRLLEVGTPEDLYRRPKTEFVATFLGTANLLVGQSDNEEVQLGPVRYNLPSDGMQLMGQQRVQVLFRPEDVILAPSPDELGCCALGCGEVQDVSFSGAFERLRLVMPPIPGVRPIAPKVAFGTNSIGVEVTRLPEQTQDYPLRPGQEAWIGVRRFHALQHPGISILILTDGTLLSQAAISFGGQLAQIAHARVTLLGYGEQGEDDASLTDFDVHIQEARKTLGSGLASLDVQISQEPPAKAAALAVERQAYDLVIVGFRPQEDIPLAEELFTFGEHHLLLVPGPQSLPEKALISVAGGEPAKDNVFFAGRLLRHLGAAATLFSVMRDGEISNKRTEQFLFDGIRTLSLMDVPADSAIKTGSVKDEILREFQHGGYDLLVLGSPLLNRYGKISFEGLLEGIFASNFGKAVLIVRSHFAGLHKYTQIREKTNRSPESILRGA